MCVCIQKDDNQTSLNTYLLKYKIFYILGEKLRKCDILCNNQ